MNHEGWVGLGYAMLEWLQGWGSGAIAAFFLWVGLVIMVVKRGYPWKRGTSVDAIREALEDKPK